MPYRHALHDYKTNCPSVYNVISIKSLNNGALTFEPLQRLAEHLPVYLYISHTVRHETAHSFTFTHFH